MSIGIAVILLDGREGRSPGAVESGIQLAQELYRIVDRYRIRLIRYERRGQYHWVVCYQGSWYHRRWTKDDVANWLRNRMGW